MELLLIVIAIVCFVIAALSPFTSMALIFWFKDRTDEKAREATVAAVAAASGTGSGAPLLRKVDETTEDTNQRVQRLEDTSS
jgi:hypothetical protein